MPDSLDSSMRDWETHLPSIRKLKEEGKVRYIGITIHRDTGHEQMMQLMQLMREENLKFIQVNYNLVERAVATLRSASCGRYRGMTGTLPLKLQCGSRG